MDPTMQEFKLKHLLLKLFVITISYHSSGVNTLQCHFMYKNLKSFVSRCECVSCNLFVTLWPNWIWRKTHGINEFENRMAMLTNNTHPFVGWQYKTTTINTSSGKRGVSYYFQSRIYFKWSGKWHFGIRWDTLHQQWTNSKWVWVKSYNSRIYWNYWKYRISHKEPQYIWWTEWCAHK